MRGQGEQDDRPTESRYVRGWCECAERQESRSPHLHQLPKPQIKEKTSTVRPGSSTHLSNLQMRHLTDNLTTIEHIGLRT